MKKLNVSLFIFITLASATGCTANNRLGNATVTVHVVDDEGQSIQGIHSKIMSASDYGFNAGVTDENGFYSVFLRNISLNISGYFEKHGYYETSGEFWNWGMGQGLVPPADTNFIIVLKRIINPVPMIQKHIETLLPINDEPIGFDFEFGDWVFPHGKGKNTDFQMTGFTRFESQRNREAKITMDFTKELCGIQSFFAPDTSDWRQLRSQLMPPHTAPEDGYEPILSLWRIVDASYYPKTHEMKDRNYLFRTRVVVDDKGKIIKANYGWTIGEIIIEAKKDNRIWMRFSYYYNPDPHSCSLEPKEIADRQAKDPPKGGE